MSLQEQYQEIKDVAEKLSLLGVNVQIDKSPSLNNNGILKSNQSDKIDQKDWIAITMLNCNDFHEEITNYEKDFMKNGVYFDKYFSYGTRKWFIDWSFNLAQK